MNPQALAIRQLKADALRAGASAEGRNMTYPGGKNGAGVYQALINLMPPHDTYIEPFLGSGAIMRLKRPARSSIGIDADADVITAFSDEEIRIPNLELVHGDAIAWLETQLSYNVPGHFTPRTLIYLDPPYLRHVRASQAAIYRHEFTDSQHLELLALLKRLPCMVMVSGYWSTMYAEHLKTWRTHHFPARTRGGSTATEYVWLNFPLPLELHDYRYLGANFRERERIKRKKLRWRTRLERMPALERYALLDVLADLRSGTIATGEASGGTVRSGEAAGTVRNADAAIAGIGK